MAKNVNHIQHVKSNVLVDGTPKLPQPSALVEGEIAVNYADGYETLSIKTSSGNIATFSSDKYYTEQHLGSAFTGDNSANTVTSWVENKERAVAAAMATSFSSITFVTVFAVVMPLPSLLSISVLL